MQYVNKDCNIYRTQMTKSLSAHKWRQNGQNSQGLWFQLACKTQNLVQAAKRPLKK